MSEKQMRLGALEAGGTKMVCAVVSGDGEVLDRMETPTLTPAETVPQMIEWFTARDVDALGIGAFGPTCVDPNDERYGSILQTPKLAWRGHGLRAAFADALGIPVAYDTDVNVACLGEVVFGCCKGLEDAVYVTIGTGVGAGVMCAGRLLHGMLHPEAGHMLVRTRPTEEGRCVCPSHASCLEGLASGPAIAARWGKPAAELADNDEVWALEGDYLGQMCANLVLMHSPRRIVLGGGVMHRSSSTASSARRPSNIWVATSRPPSLRTWRATSAPRAAAATKESSARPSWQEGRSRNLRSLRHTTR